MARQGNRMNSKWLPIVCVLAAPLRGFVGIVVPNPTLKRGANKLCAYGAENWNMLQQQNPFMRLP
jgi:hypothetical protein